MVVGSDDVVPLAFPVLAQVKDVPLHLLGQGLELVPKTGEDLTLACDEVGDVSVRAEVADDDDAVVGQDELFKSLFVTTVDDIGEDGVAVAPEHGLDDLGADSSVRLVMGGGGIHHISYPFNNTKVVKKSDLLWCQALVLDLHEGAVKHVGEEESDGEEESFHILWGSDYITKITLFSLEPVGVAQPGQPGIPEPSPEVGAGCSPRQPEAPVLSPD